MSSSHKCDVTVLQRNVSAYVEYSTVRITMVQMVRKLCLLVYKNKLGTGTESLFFLLFLHHSNWTSLARCDTKMRVRGLVLLALVSGWSSAAPKETREE